MIQCRFVVKDQRNDIAEIFAKMTGIAVMGKLYELICCTLVCNIG